MMKHLILSQYNQKLADSLPPTQNQKKKKKKEKGF